MLIELLTNTKQKDKSSRTGHFNSESSADVRSFHKTIHGYKPTPLIKLNGMADRLGVKNIWLKDESFRFGLNAFKVLGASYAVAKLFFELFDLNDSDFSLDTLRSQSAKHKLKDFTLVTATDGNHGRGVAWTAQHLGCNCVVYMPKGTTVQRARNIESTGATVTIIDGNYDQAVQTAKTNSEKNNWFLVQDTSWNGYEKIPEWIMRGYLTIADEITEQLKGNSLTHIFIQSGVGSLPAAIAAYYIERNENEKPIFAVVEPAEAACAFEAIRADEIISLTGGMNTIMAGLACGTISKLAWDILKNHSDFFIKCSDDVTISGMNLLGKQKFGDAKIISGESGAVTTGLIYQLLSDEKFKFLAQTLKLSEKSKILLISTEGDTDPEMYRRILSL